MSRLTVPPLLGRRVWLARLSPRQSHNCFCQFSLGWLTSFEPLLIKTLSPIVLLRGLCNDVDSKFEKGGRAAILRLVSQKSSPFYFFGIGGSSAWLVINGSTGSRHTPHLQLFLSGEARLAIGLMGPEFLDENYGRNLCLKCWSASFLDILLP